MAVADGEPGTGKTLLGLRFLESLPPDTQRVMAQVPPGVTPAGFLQAILFDLGKPYHGLSEQELRLAVYGELLAALGDGRRVEALTFLSDTRHPQWAGDLSLETQAAMIAGASGLSGRNVDYLRDLVEHLRAEGVRDRAMEQLLSMVEAREAEAA